jgi:hypothetical protein
MSRLNSARICRRLPSPRARCGNGPDLFSPCLATHHRAPAREPFLLRGATLTKFWPRTTLSASFDQRRDERHTQKSRRGSDEPVLLANGTICPYTQHNRGPRCAFQS